MPIPTPYHERTSRLCTSYKWKEWAGYYAVCSYEMLHEPEYFAFRYAAGLLDITPLFKYRITGKDAATFLSKVMVKDISKQKPGRVSYLCWCNDEGKVVDDGTVMRLDEDLFFVTSADPMYYWFKRFERGFDVVIEDRTDKIAALALQGPMSRDILKQLTDANMDSLKFFGICRAKIDGINVNISRTGYTGDLGYEIWTANDNALKLWDAIFSAGKNYGLMPAGLDALDMTRIEAGLILKNVDYYNAQHALVADRMSSPYELGLGWLVQLDRAPFNGQKALKLEKENKLTKWSIAGLDVSWTALEAICNSHGLPPEVPSRAWRASVPVYDPNDITRQIGYATSGTWSPVLKKNIALATILREFDKPAKKVLLEATIEHKRYTVPAIVSKPQFFDPERKKS